MSIQKILLAYDFGLASQAALRQACQFADSFHAELFLLHVVAEKWRVRRALESAADRCRAAEEQLIGLLDSDLVLKVHPNFVVREGSPAREIVDYALAEQVDLIVMGTAGRTGLAHATLGSVAERVLQTAPCPVLVIRADGDVGDASAAEHESIEQFDQFPSDDEGPALDLLSRALAARATDVHLDPLNEEEYLLRFRVDGRLVRYCTLGRDVGEHLIQRFKLLGDLEIADPFRAQEGRLKISSKIPNVEARITTSPVEGGEAVALRLFIRESLLRPINALGLSNVALTDVDRMLANGEGMVLVTGPTGSGKTTTVYSLLSELGSDSRNIVSIEDPVEYPIPYVRQMAVDERHGVTMTSGLKTLLRMDPDVMFVGEIRDVEAADIAMRAASSGKFVLSTLHTRDVAATITACRDLHVDNRSLAGNLSGVVSQRLIRRLCQECRMPLIQDDRMRESLEACGLEPSLASFEATGCEHCSGRGYLGRIGVFEVAWITDELRTAIATGTYEADLRTMLRSGGSASLFSDAIDKVRQGLTSVSEVLAEIPNFK